MSKRLHLVDGREYEVKADLVQVVALFDRQRLAFVKGSIKLTVDEVEAVRERDPVLDKRQRQWHSVDDCYLAPRATMLRWTHPIARVARDTSTASTRSKLSQRVEQFVLEHPGCAAAECAEAMKCHRFSAQRALNELKQDGRVQSRRVRNPHGSFGIIDLWWHATATVDATESSGRET